MSAKKLLAATMGALAGAAVLAAPAAAAPGKGTAAPAAVDCTAYQEVSTDRTFRAGYESVPWSYFWNEGDETFSLCVDVPDSAEVLVEVREWKTEGWTTVHTAPAGIGDKEFTYHVVKPSMYRLYVTGLNGSTGTYTAGLSFSRFEK